MVSRGPIHRPVQLLTITVLGDNNARGGPDLLFLRNAGVPVADLKQNGWLYCDLHNTANDTLDKIATDAPSQNVAASAAFLYPAAETKLTFR